MATTFKSPAVKSAIRLYPEAYVTTKGIARDQEYQDLQEILVSFTGPILTDDDQPVAPSPTIEHPGNQTTTVTKPFTLTMTATGGDDFEWSATGLPTGLTIDADTGVISGTPTTVGTFKPRVTVENGDGGTRTLSFDIVVEQLEVVIVDPGVLNGVVNEEFTYSFDTTETLTNAVWTTEDEVEGFTLTEAGVFSGTPTEAGEIVLTITVTAEEGSDSLEVTILVAEEA